MSTPTFPPTSHRTVSANQDPMTPQVRKWFYETFFSQQEQASWTNEVLPAIIGMLDPPPGWEREPIPEYVPGRNGEPVVAANGIKVRNLVHLPNVLQNYQEIRGWTVEAYFRGHRDFQYHDIRVRQPNGGTDYHNSAMSNKRTRHCRKLYPMRSWVLKAHGVTRTLVELVDSLTQAQIQQNTTWIVLPQGIQQPGNPNRILALDHFLHDRQPHQPSERLRGALTEWTRLRALAVEHNKTNWRALPSHLLPGYSRVKGTGVRAKMAQAKVVVSPQTSTEPLATPLPSRTSASITARSGKGKNNEEDYRDTGFFDEGFYGEDDEEEEYAWSEDVGGDTGGEESFDAGSVAHGHVYSKLGFEKLLGNLPQEEHDIDTVLAAQLDVANPHHSAGNHDSVCMTKESDVPQELLDPAMFRTMSQLSPDSYPAWLKDSLNPSKPSSGGPSSAKQYKGKKRGRLPNSDEGYVSGEESKQSIKSVKKQELDNFGDSDTIVVQRRQPRVIETQLPPRKRLSTKSTKIATRQPYAATHSVTRQSLGLDELGLGTFGNDVALQYHQNNPTQQYSPYQSEYYQQSNTATATTTVGPGFGYDKPASEFGANAFENQQQQQQPVSAIYRPLPPPEPTEDIPGYIPGAPLEENVARLNAANTGRPRRAQRPKTPVFLSSPIPPRLALAIPRPVTPYYQQGPFEAPRTIPEASPEVDTKQEGSANYSAFGAQEFGDLFGDNAPIPESMFDNTPTTPQNCGIWQLS